MKKILATLLVISLFACKEEKKSNVENEVMKVENEGPAQWLTFKGNEGAKQIVLVSGDEEYRSEEALPQLAKILSKHHGFNCTVLFAQDPALPGIVNGNYQKNIPGLEALDTADLMVIFTRFRGLPDTQMQHIDAFLKAGKPVIGLRTATHAFDFKDSTATYAHYGNYYKGEKTAWKDGFGKFILGENWYTHHGHHKYQSTRGVFANGADGSPIVKGVKSGGIWGATDVYGVHLPLPGDSKPIILGQVIDRAGEFDANDLFFGMKGTDTKLAEVNNNKMRVNDTLMPIVWTKSYQLPDGQKGKALTSTIGAATDLLNEDVRRIIVNGVFWGLGESPQEITNVDLVGDYKPSQFGFKKNEYWIEKKLTVESLK